MWIKKRFISRMRELENPKMVNEISFESLRGPITPCRADGQVIFPISPRKKSGKFLFVWTLQAHAIKTDLRTFRTARSIPHWPAIDYFNYISASYNVIIKPDTGYCSQSNCIFLYAIVCFCVRRDKFGSGGTYLLLCPTNTFKKSNSVSKNSGVFEYYKLHLGHNSSIPVYP